MEYHPVVFLLLPKLAELDHEFKCFAWLVQGSEQENPLYNNESLMDTIDSMGGEQNPLFDSMTGQQISADRAHRNALFGSNILDSLDNRCLS